jgi:hypothetical protein
MGGGDRLLADCCVFGLRVRVEAAPVYIPIPACAAVQRTKPPTSLNPNPKSKDIDSDDEGDDQGCFDI